MRAVPAWVRLIGGNDMRKIFAVAAATALTFAMSTTAFAAWKQDKTGQWRYMTSDSTWLTSTTTPDGYRWM